MSSQCPSCSDAILCGECGRLRDYQVLSPFAVLGLDASFEIDLEILEQRYFELQLQIHPDRFAVAEEGVKETALKWSVDINAAYQALKNPLSRAESLLVIQGVSTDVTPDPALLGEMMVWREALMDVESSEDKETLLTRSKQALTETLDEITSAFASQQQNKVPSLLMITNSLY